MKLRKQRDKFTELVCDGANCEEIISRANREITAARAQGRGLYCSRACISKLSSQEEFRFGLIPDAETYDAADLALADGGPRSLRLVISKKKVSRKKSK